MISEGGVAYILEYTLATGLNVARRLHITAYARYRRRHGEYLLRYPAPLTVTLRNENGKQLVNKKIANM
jgi:hypothetical protein